MEDLVSRELRKGWILLGGLAVVGETAGGSHCLYQAMIRPQEAPIPTGTRS